MSPVTISIGARALLKVNNNTVFMRKTDQIKIAPIQMLKPEVET